MLREKITFLTLIITLLTIGGAQAQQKSEELVWYTTWGQALQDQTADQVAHDHLASIKDEHHKDEEGQEQA